VGPITGGVVAPHPVSVTTPTRETGRNDTNKLCPMWSFMEGGEKEGKFGITRDNGGGETRVSAVTFPDRKTKDYL